MGEDAEDALQDDAWMDRDIQDQIAYEEKYGNEALFRYIRDLETRVFNLEKKQGLRRPEEKMSPEKDGEHFQEKLERAIKICQSHMAHSEFHQSVMGFFLQNGRMTEKQVEAVLKGYCSICNIEQRALAPRPGDADYDLDDAHLLGLDGDPSDFGW